MMGFVQSLIFLFAVAASTCASYNDSFDASAGPRPLSDRFRLIQNNVNETELQEEIQDFLAYGCEKMVVIRNKAQDDVKLSCRSHNDAPKETVIQPGNAYSFILKPYKSGKSYFWCTLEYKQQFARFDVYNEDRSYMHPREFEEILQYTVKHDGVYADKNKDNGRKIKALMKGHNKFTLWENFVDGEGNGLLLTGLVDGGMCYDIPQQFNDKAAAVAVCGTHCVHLYEHYGCHGRMQTVQAQGDCNDVELNNELRGRLSSLQGC